MQTENIGVEQSRLDAVGDARVIVSSLNPAEEIPHLELLGYETGRRRPITMAASNDIAATYVVLQTPDLARTARALAADSARFISPGICTMADGTQAVMILDPDGHRFIAEEVKWPGADTSTPLMYSFSRRAIRLVGLKHHRELLRQQTQPRPAVPTRPRWLRWLLFDAAKTSPALRPGQPDYDPQIRQRYDANRAALSQADASSATQCAS